MAVSYVLTDPDEVYDHHRRLTFGQFLEREERRFVAADQDGDGKLTKDEFANFLHPGICKGLQGRKAHLTVSCFLFILSNPPLPL